MKTSKKNGRSSTQRSVMNWIDKQLESDAKLRQQVEEMLNEMRIEQDLVSLRQRKGFSQSQLARKLGVSQPAIAKLESGKVRNLGLKTLVRYTAALGGRLRIDVRSGRKQPR